MAKARLEARQLTTQKRDERILFRSIRNIYTYLYIEAFRLGPQRRNRTEDGLKVLQQEEFLYRIALCTVENSYIRLRCTTGPTFAMRDNFQLPHGQTSARCPSQLLPGPR